MSCCDAIAPRTYYNNKCSGEKGQILLRSNYLSEFNKESDKSKVRDNLGVYSKEAVYNKDEIDKSIEALKEAIENKLSDDVWITSGPIKTTVGFMEDNSPVPTTMTFQQICDSIFYGRGTSIYVPDEYIYKKPTQIQLCINGDSNKISKIELYQNYNLLNTYTKDDFNDRCIVVDTESINANTFFETITTYTDGTTYRQNATINASLPIFVGLLPNDKTSVDMNYLISSCKDGEGSFLNQEGNIYSYTYNFSSEEPKHIFIAVPETHSDLISINTNLQSSDDFDIIHNVSIRTVQNINYKLYIYKQGLVTLNQQVNFIFK